MKDLSLQEIIPAHTEILANPLKEFLPLMYVLLLLGKRSVSPGHMATTMRWTPQQVEEILQTWGRYGARREGALQTVAGSGCALDRLLVSQARREIIPCHCYLSGDRTAGSPDRDRGNDERPEPTRRSPLPLPPWGDHQCRVCASHDLHIRTVLCGLQACLCLGHILMRYCFLSKRLPTWPMRLPRLHAHMQHRSLQ